MLNPIIGSMKALAPVKTKRSGKGEREKKGMHGESAEAELMGIWGKGEMEKGQKSKQKPCVVLDGLEKRRTEACFLL